MFYNGSEEQEEYTVQRLSDAFVETVEHPALELEVILYNIRRKGSHVPAILERSKSLDDYSILVETVEACRADGYSLEEAIKRAIQQCCSCGIMPEYLQENGAEVLNMLLTEWDWDVAKDVWKEEAFAEGEIKGLLVGYKEMGLSMEAAIEKIMEKFNVTREDVIKKPRCIGEDEIRKQKTAKMTKLELAEVEALAEQIEQ